MIQSISNEEWIDYLGKGKKAPVLHTHYHKNAPKKDYTPSTADMLHTAKRKTQAILKITNYGKGKDKIMNHLSYISRNATLALENDKGEKLTSRKDHLNVLNAWQVDFGTRKNSRDTVHLMLSSPPGTSPKIMENVAREFLKNEFSKNGYEYLFVLHQDKDHPHVHCVIKMTGIHGQKLNPRKGYLYELRKKYASLCREHGIEVEASSRCERGLPGKSLNSKMVQMRQHGRLPKKDKEFRRKNSDKKSELPHIADLKMQRRNHLIRKRYAERSQELYKEGKLQTSVKDQTSYFQAGKSLEQHAKTMPTEISQVDNVYPNKYNQQKSQEKQQSKELALELELKLKTSK